MKVLIYGDVHFCQYASILRRQGNKYSQRLEGLINSLNWAESLAEEYKCDSIVGLGDFFDKSYLNAEELSALQEIKWANIPHYFIVGNHEMAESSLEISSAHLLNLIPQFTLIEKPSLYTFGDKIEFGYLPYILETNRQPISSYFPSIANNAYRIIFSHNDIAGVQMGAIESKDGFDKNDILNNSNLFINGHIHSGSWITENRIINLGNLTGANFSEDALTYSHNIMIVDINPDSPQYDNPIKYKFIENPYAFNFYKLGIINNVAQFPYFKPNAVVSCGAAEQNLSILKSTLDANPNVIESRVMLTKEAIKGDSSQVIDAFKPIDHLAQFKQSILEMFGSDEITIHELEEILK